jgi:hypothetical protein
VEPPLAPQTDPQIDSQIDPQISRIFAACETAYGCFDFATVRELWSRRERPFYLAEEEGDYFTSWPQIEDYWARLPRALDQLELRLQPRVSVPLAEDRQWVGFSLVWRARTGSSPAIAGEVRGVALLVREDGEWRLQGWVEAPLAPIAYMRGLYQHFARTLDQR